MELLSFRKFNEKESAEAVGRLFHQNNIVFEVVSDASSMDSLYGGSELNNFYHVRIKGSDFVRAKEILIENFKMQVNTTASDHYLFEFSDEELLEVVYKSDEWSEFDYLLAKRILKERGKEMRDEVIEKLNQDRRQALSKPEELEVSLSYAKSMLGIFGALMAWSIITHKKTLPDGHRVYTYSRKTRDQAQLLFFLSMFVFFVTLLAILGVIRYTSLGSVIF